jgi:uncharacterized membrane protein
MSDVVFGHPGWLWLLLLVPAIVIAGLFSRRKLSRARTITVLVIRSVLVAMLALALSEPGTKKRSDYVTAYFLLDRSGSIPEGQKQWSLDVARQAVASKQRREDRAGVIVFGEKPIVEESPVAELKLRELFSVVDPDNTDIAAAVRLALSTFPDDSQKRIVLITDGNETRGELLEMATRAAGAGVPVDVVPLKYRYDNEVLLESLTLPRKVTKDEPFQVRVVVASFGVSKGTLRIYADGNLLGSREVPLARGENVFVLSHLLKDSGFHLLEAEIVGEQDGIAQNNRAQAYTIIEDESMVLLAGGTEEDVRHLSQALKEENIAHRVRIAGSLPQDLGEWQSYDVILFANLGAEHVSKNQMEMIESLVHDLGAGFIMVGGEHSFGAGGYLGTPLAKALPVDLDVNQNQVLPNGAIAFLLDHIHCIGDRWSKDIVVGTLNAMTRFDHLGMIAGDTGWALPLTEAVDKPRMRGVIDGASVGDINDVGGCIDRALDSLATSRAGYRHLVLITDGGGNIVPDDAAVGRVRSAGATLSIVVIEPRGGNTGDLQRAARMGGGNFYVIQPHERALVPQVIVKESVRVKKGLYFEERFVPKMALGSPELEGIGPSELPPLRGYNVTSKKSPTEVPLLSNHDDAVLAHWQYGLGKSVAFTSDAAGRWGAEWIRWGKFRQFWGQTVRFVQRRMPASPYQLTLQRGRTEGTAEAVVDAVDQDGKFVNFLEPSGTLLRPDLEGRSLVFSQVGPGRYKATFPTDKSGGYVVNVRYREKGGEYLLRGGYVPPYQPEYHRFEDNAALLAAVAERTGGRVIEPSKAVDFFAPTTEVTYTSRILWPLLVMLAVILLPVDVFLRRVIIGPRDVVEMTREGLGRVIPALKPKRDRVAEAVEAERAAIKERSVYVPEAKGAEVAAEGEAVEAPAAAEVEGSAEVMTTNRLREAKERAKRKMERK